jgi:hypothetical protein
MVETVSAVFVILLKTVRSYMELSRMPPLPPEMPPI